MGQLACVSALLMLAALLVACTSGQQDAAPVVTTLEAAASRGPFGVGVTTLELVDPTRPTEPNRDFEGASERRFTVEVWYPTGPSAEEPEDRDAALDQSQAPYPLIVFAHGLGGNRRQSPSYTQHLASHGYVVASPDFPLSNLGAPGGPRLAAVIHQPADVAFLIDSLLDPSDQEDHLLAGAIDGGAIGVTGHSLGGLTSLLTVYGPARDERVRTVLPIAAPGCFLTPEMVGDVDVPIMVVGGSRDLIVNPASIRQAYNVAQPPRYYVELMGADHTRFADVALEDEAVLALLPGLLGGNVVEDATTVARRLGGRLEACSDGREIGDEALLTAERQRELLRAFATPFFDAYLRGSDAARDFLEDELPGLVPEARVEFEAE